MTSVINQEHQMSPRREYSAPQLVHYGLVSDLTASGSGNGAECQGNGGGNSICGNSTSKA